MKPKYTFVRYRVSRRFSVPGVLAIALAMALTSKPARAASGSWNVDAAGGWVTTTNWTPVAVPGSAIGDVIDFANNIGAARTITLDGARTLGDLNIGDSTTPFFGFTINTGTGGTLTMDATTAPASIDFLNAGTNGAANTIGAGITLIDATVIRSNNDKQHVFSGVINDGAASLGLTFNNDVNGTANAAVSNQGQFSLTVANTYDGGTSISDVRVATGIAGSFGTGAVSITGAGQAYLTAGTIANAFNLNTTGWVESAGNLGALRIETAILTGTVTMQRDTAIGVNSGTGSINGALNGVFNFTKSRGGLLVLGGANNMAGVTIVNDGQQRLNSAGALGNSPTVIVENPANPGASDTNALQLTGGFTLGAGRTLILRNNSTSNIGNARTALENTSGNNTWTGNIVLDSGTNQTLTSTAGIFTIAGNVTQSAVPSSQLFVRGNGTGLITGNINIGSASLFKTDGGTWTFSSSGHVYSSLGIGNGTLVANTTNAFNPALPITLGENNGNNTRLTINAGFTQGFSAISTFATTSGSQTIDGAGSLDVGAGGTVVTVNEGAAVNDLTISANIIGSGGITKVGSGNLVLNNTTSGPVTVSAGTLTSTATLGGLSLASGTTLVPGTPTAPGTITTSTLALTDGTLAVNLGAAGSDVINVTNSGGLTQSGTTTINVTPNGGFNPASTFYPVINYTGTSPGTGGFTVGTLPGRLAGSVFDNGSAIGITATSDRVIWTGAAANGNWDVNTTTNWKKQSDSSGTNFLSQDDVIFNDDGIAQNSIALTGTINPTRVEFAHTGANTYTFASGTLSGEGVMPFIHSGTGTTILRNTNTFTGPTTITAGTVELDQSTGTLSATSGVTVDSPGTLKLTRNNADFTFNRNISGSGTVLVDPNASGTAGARGATLSGNNSGFSGTWDLDPSGTYLTNGTFRTNTVAQNNLGTAGVIVRDGGQLWVAGGVTLANNLTLTGAGYQEGAGGTPATVATGADGSSPSLPTLAYGGIGAVRLEANGVLSGTITLDGDAKIMPYNTTGTLTGSITNTASSDDLVVGGGGAGTNLIITGDSSGLERIWVNGGGTAGTNTLIIGNNTTTGTLGSGDVILYQDAAIAAVRFQRTDGYTLAQNIISAHNGTATNMARGGVQINTLGTGFTLGSNTIDLSDGTNGGSINVGNTVNGAIFNIGTGATVETGFFGIGEAANNSATVIQTGGAVAINGIATNTANNLRVGHFATNTSTYNLSGGTISFNAGAPASTPSAGGELGGGIYVGVDGQGIFNQSGGSVSTNWVVLDNRVNTAAGANMTTGIDQYNLSLGDLELKSIYGIIGRNTSTVLNLSGGTIRNTGADATDVAINSEINTTAATTTTLDTVNATRKFTLMNTINGTGTITTFGGGLIELDPDSKATRTGSSDGLGTQTISAILDGTSAVTKLGSGTTTLSGANTYTGATTVSAGRLDLTGSAASSAVSVANLATLGGEGSAASITLGSAATDVTNLFIDGSTPGALTSTGTLTVNGPLTDAVNVNLTSPPAGPATITVLNHGGTAATAAQFKLVNAANFRSSTFTVNATDVTLDFTNKALVWDGTTATWEIGGAENDWNDVAIDNFFTGDNVTFDDTYVLANQTVTMAGALLPGSVTVNNSTYSYTLAGSGFGGSGGLTKSGSSSLDLGGANTFTGPVAISGGILKMTTATALGSGSAGITVSGTGTLDLGAVTANTINLGSRVVTISGSGAAGAGAITQTSANQQTNAFRLLTLAGDSTIAGTGRYDVRGTTSVLDLAGFTLTKQGVNQVYATVDGTITSGNVEANAGIFAVWNGTVQGTGYLRANTGGTIELSNIPAGKVTRPITLNGGSFTNLNASTIDSAIVYTAASTISNAADFNLIGTLAETGGPFDLVKTGAGSLILTGTNSLTGKVNVSTGILRVPTDAFLGPVPGSPVADSITLQAGGRIQAGNATVGNDITISANRGISLPSGDGGFHVWIGFTMNYAGSISGVGNLTKTDGGTLSYTGTASHTGATTINGGISTFTGATVSSTNILQVGTATLNIAAGSAITTPRFVTSQGSGTVSVINQSGGSLTVTGTNSLNDNTASFLFGHWGTGAASTYNLSGGILNSVGAELSMGWDASSVINQSGGTANLLGLDLGNTRNNLAIYGLTGGTLNLGANGITTNTNKVVNLGGGTLGAFANWTTGQAMVLTANGGNVTVNTLDSVDNTTARNITTTGALSGPGGLVKTGLGTLLFNGAAQYTGTTTVNGGTLAVDGNQPGNRLSNNHQVTVNNGGTFQINGVNALAQGANAVDFTLNNGGILNVVTGFSAASPAAASHAHIRNLTLNGGTVDFSYSGTGGTYSTESFILGGQITAGGTSVSTIQSSTTAALSGLAIQGTKTFSVADATGSAATDLLVTAEIEDGDSTGGVTKTGAGTMEVTAVNSYTNGTNVNVGKLLVNNASGSGTGTNTVTVATGAFLGGTGTIAGATTVNGTLEPGSNAVGTLNVGSTVGLAVGSTYAVEITGAATNDKVAATGALTANGTIAVTLSGYVPVLGNTFDIADASGFSGTPTFNFAAAPLTVGLVWDTSQFLTNGTISVVSADPYNAWAAANGIVEGKFGDDDDDGVVNLLEFATNSDAADGSSGARVYPKMHLLGGDNVLTYTVAVRKNAIFATGVPDASKQQATKDQILYTIEASNDLAVWNVVTVTKLNPGDSTAVQAAITPALPALDADWEWHTFRTDGGVSIDASDFIRLNVVVAP